MKRKVKLLCIGFIIFSFCAHSSYRPKFFSKDNLNFNQLPELYRNIPFFQGDVIYQFIDTLQEPEIPKDSIISGIVGVVECHPLISEAGEVIAVYIKHPLSPLADKASIVAILNSKFKTYQQVTGQTGKYSLIIPFKFYILYERKLDYFFKKKNEK
jgi:hypothetical protein